MGGKVGKKGKALAGGKIGSVKKGPIRRICLGGGGKYKKNKQRLKKYLPRKKKKKTYLPWGTRRGTGGKKRKK